MDVILHRPIDLHRVRLRKEFGFAVCIDKADEDFVSGLDGDGTAVVVDGLGDRAESVGAKGSVESDAFHGVVEQFVVCFGACGFRPFWQGLCISIGF